MKVEIGEGYARAALGAVKLKLLVVDNVDGRNDRLSIIRKYQLLQTKYHLEDALKKCEEANGANHPN